MSQVFLRHDGGACLKRVRIGSASREGVGALLQAAKSDSSSDQYTFEIDA
jgi:hypothetical protein